MVKKKMSPFSPGISVMVIWKNQVMRTFSFGSKRNSQFPWDSEREFSSEHDFHQKVVLLNAKAAS